MMFRSLLTLSLLFGLATPLPAQSLGERIKEIFSTPTPTPSPHRKKKSPAKKSPTPSPSPSPSAHKKKKPSPTPGGEKFPSPKHKKKSSPTPEPTETPSPSVSPSATETPAQTSPSPEQKKGESQTATLSADAIAGFEKYPTKIQNLLTAALELTARNLDYKYGSADPANGGMDCSGFVYFVLTQSGVSDVPRDSSGQYVWVRRAGTFEPVVSRKDDSFEFDDLKPGDLLFWTGTYSIERDPPITHTMIYLGREKKTGARVMVGSSDGRTYQSQQRFGVSVFDFKMPRAEKGEVEDVKTRPRFIGYAHIPGLQE
jgi:cell wall-associated NlpC family hydrolase